MPASQRAYELLSQTLLQCIDTTLHALWQPLSAQLRVSVSAPTLQAVVHSTVALQWLGAWLSQSTAPTAIPIPEASVSLSANVEDLAQIAADVAATGAAANRVQLFLAAPMQVGGANDAPTQRFLQGDAPSDMSLPWFPSAYYGVAAHTILVHILSSLVHLSVQDSRVIVLPVTYAHASDARIDFFFDATVPQENTAWPAWLGPQANLQHVLDELGMIVTQGLLKPDDLAALPLLAPLLGATNATYLQVSLRRPRSIDLISSGPAPVRDGAPSLERLVHGLPLEAMQPHLAHRRVRLIPSGLTDALCVQIRAYLHELGCEVDVAQPDRLGKKHAAKEEAANAGANPNGTAPSGAGAGGPAGPGSHPDPGAGTGASSRPAPASASTPAPASASTPASAPDFASSGPSPGPSTPADGAPSAPATHDPPVTRPRLASTAGHVSSSDTFSEHALSGLNADGQRLDMMIVHDNPTVLHSLLTAHVPVPIVYFATPVALERIAAEAFGAGVVFLPEPVGHIRLLWALFSAWFEYDPSTHTYYSEAGTRLHAAVPPPQGYQTESRSRTSSRAPSLVPTPNSTENLDRDPLARPSNSRESSTSSFTDLLEEEEADPFPERGTPMGTSAPEKSAGAAAPASPQTVVAEPVHTPVQRVQETPDYFTKAVSQLATKSSNSGLVIRSVDGRAAGIFFHPPTEADHASPPPPPPPPHSAVAPLPLGAASHACTALDSAPSGPRSNEVLTPLMASPNTELSVSNTTFHTEPADVALSVTDPVHGEKRYPSGHVLEPEGFERILGLDEGTAPLAAASPTPAQIPAERSLAMERPPSMERPGAPKFIELPPPPPLPAQTRSEVVKGQPTPYSHLPTKLKRASAQPQAGLLIGGTFARDERKETHPAPPTSGHPSPTAATRLQRRKMALRDDFLPPVKVLIVEDNVINQRILSTFLRKRQIKYDVAKDGREAVDKWQQGDFHLILMDIQLPVLDGIEATKEIRRREGEARHTPAGEARSGLASLASRHSVIIVALTASVLNSDRVAALAAGCNDFLNKPVSLPWLQRKILEWGSMQYLLHAGRSALEMPAPTDSPTREAAPRTATASTPAPPTAPPTASTAAPPAPDGAPGLEAPDAALTPPAPRGFDQVLDEKAQQVAERLHLRPPHRDARRMSNV